MVPSPAADSLTRPAPGFPVPQLVTSKLTASSVPEGALTRHRLIEVLHQDRRVALISAPAGFGKSTLLAQWTATCDVPVAWVTLDADDSDPARFWAHVIGALDRADPGRSWPHADVLGISSVDEVVCAISNQMDEAEGGVVLALDDYHEIDSEEVDRSVERLIARLPERARIVIATRRDPDVALARLRAAEQLAEVRQRDLCFTEEEAVEWLERRGIEATSDTVKDSLAVTEGWPAAYTLLFGSGRRLGEGNFRLDHRHVADYIREEVVEGHGDASSLLTVAAFCPWVCAPMLEHTLGIANGWEALRGLERSDLLLERVDGSGERYRLHRLVAEYVLLGHETDDDVCRWMQRAAEWYTANGHPRIALDTLIRAGEHAAACDMINRSWLARMRGGQLATLRKDLARIAPEVAERNAPFLVTRAWLNAHDGRRRDALSDLERAESLAPGSPLPDGCPNVEASRAVINALYAVEGLTSAEESARQVDTLVDGASMWRPLADLAIGYASFMTGRLGEAQTAFDRVIASPDVLLRSYAVGWSTVIDVMEDRLESARARFEEVEAMWSAHPPLVNLPAVVVARSAIACAEGRPIEAAADLEGCRSLLGSSDPTDRLEVLLWLAGAEVSIGRTKRAIRWRDAAKQLIDRLGGSEWHQRRLSDIEDRMGPNVERNGRDPGLTDREVRILQLLSATHLSQREIGRELGVSFNTIKSHVKAIYVKLGATSREEASQIARNLGLI
jgi:LuxR family maltose regulon positive regulatory protein